MSAMTAFPIFDRAAGGALIASPSSALRARVLRSLNGRWRPVQHAEGGAETLVKLEEGNWQVLFLDRRLPDLDSEELMAIIQQRFPGIQVVLVDSDAALVTEDEGKSELEVVESRCYEPLPGMIGESEAMQRIYRLAQLVAPRMTSVLIVGPTGSGKELVARAL